MASEQIAYWPWWAGAVGLVGVSLAYFGLTGRTLGVSGSYDRTLRGPKATNLSPEAERLLANPQALEAALLAATQEEFGEAFADDAELASRSQPVAAVAAPLPQRPGRLSWGQHAALLVGLTAGGALFSLLHGGWHLGAALPSEVVHTVGSGAGGWLFLFFGGLLAGFGARLSGGCTSGHGLTGCGRLQLPSLVATATFFSAAIATSWLLFRWL